MKFSFVIFLLALPCAAAELDGIWSTNCAQQTIREEAFQAAKVSLFELSYTDAGCTNLGLEMQSIGGYAIDTDPVAAGLRSIDFQFQSVQITLRSKEYLDFFQQEKMCGFSDWQLNESRDVTGLVCALFGAGHSIQVPKSGDMRYGIFQHTGKELWFGKLTPEQNGLTSASRPSVLDPSAYKRK